MRTNSATSVWSTHILAIWLVCIHSASINDRVLEGVNTVDSWMSRRPAHAYCSPAELSKSPAEPRTIVAMNGEHQREEWWNPRMLELLARSSPMDAHRMNAQIQRAVESAIPHRPEGARPRGRAIRDACSSSSQLLGTDLCAAAGQDIEPFEVYFVEVCSAPSSSPPAHGHRLGGRPGAAVQRLRTVLG